ncbi:hypothetical protein B0H17DRAFT_1148449 [Mycena rosella]|uniref:Uncharacterized protein n=1 Tax=Mycena rosella TaxID=1033263 RepID=A0AAD7CCT9_MYCRO|nr:hypothetical protein B0H17DRAFT_1148449 [Mycena rosella]
MDKTFVHLPWRGIGESRRSARAMGTGSRAALDGCAGEGDQRAVRTPQSTATFHPQSDKIILSFRGESKNAIEERTRAHPPRPSVFQASKVRSAGGAEEEAGGMMGWGEREARVAPVGACGGREALAQRWGQGTHAQTQRWEIAQARAAERWSRCGRPTGRDLAEQRRRCMQIDAASVTGAILTAGPGSPTGGPSGQGDRAWVAPAGDLPRTPTSSASTGTRRPRAGFMTPRSSNSLRVCRELPRTK